MRSDPRATGFTLIEQVVAAAILTVAALGTFRYQYYTAALGRIASGETAAARTAQLLLEDWKSTGGATTYHPSSLGLGFSSGLAVPSGFTTPAGLGTTLNNSVYSLTWGNLPLLAMLKYLDVAQDTQARTTLRQLAVVVCYAQIDQSGSMSTPESRFAGLAPITLVTYVRVDASKG